MEKIINFARKHIDDSAAAGTVNFSLVLVNILVVTMLWQTAGLSYNESFNAVVVCALLGTLIAAYYRLPVAVAPDIVLNSFLCYDLVVSHGFSWQQVMVVPLLAGMGILLLVLSGKYVKVIKALPAYFETVIPATVGIFLICRGLVMSHLVIASPLQITGMGGLNDPFVWVALPTLALVLCIISRRREYGLLAGLILSLTLAFAYGLIALPDYLFSLPEGFMDTALQFRLEEFFRLSGAVAAAFVFLMFEGISIGKIAAVGNEKEILLINGLSAAIGGLFSGGVFGVAKATAACKCSGRRNVKAPLLSAGLLLLFSFCCPLAFEIVKYPAITGAVVIGTGCCLLWDLKFLPFNDNISFLAGLFTIILSALWGNLTAGIGFGLIIYTMLMIFAGRRKELSGLLFLLTGLFFVYFYCDL